MPRRKTGITYRTLAAIARAIMWLLFRRDWAGTRRVRSLAIRRCGP